MFSKKKDDAPKGKEKDTDLKVRLDGLEMESVNEQLREIEAQKAKTKKK